MATRASDDDARAHEALVRCTRCVERARDEARERARERARARSSDGFC
jgi:hypothetical protein